MKLIHRYTVLGGVIAGMVATAFAASSVETGFGTLAGLINTFSNTVVVALGTLLMGGAVVIFFIGIVNYVWGLREGDANKAKSGSTFMLWGLLALFVMFSVYGIVKFWQDTFFGKGADVTTIQIPKLKFESTGTSGGQSPSSKTTPTETTTVKETTTVCEVVGSGSIFDDGTCLLSSGKSGTASPDGKTCCQR
jgi:hypothetical protein